MCLRLEYQKPMSLTYLRVYYCLSSWTRKYGFGQYVILMKRTPLIKTGMVFTNENVILVDKGITGAQ